MLKSGTIANIEANGGYQSQNGYISTFMLTLRNEEGQITGEIGSKSQQYPMAIGEPITVDIRTDQHGTKFKKVNPQYQQNALRVALRCLRINRKGRTHLKAGETPQ